MNTLQQSIQIIYCNNFMTQENQSAIPRWLGSQIPDCDSVTQIDRTQ